MIHVIRNSSVGVIVRWAIVNHYTILNSIEQYYNQMIIFHHKIFWQSAHNP